MQKIFNAIFMMTALVVFLTACGGGGGGGAGGGPNPPPVTKLSKFTVQELNAIPGDSSVTLSWNNPNADIASISISYHNINTPNDSPTIVNSNQINRKAPNVKQRITTDLTNGQSYNFTVNLILAEDYTGREGTAPSVIVAIGSNLDGDSLADFVDDDIDGDDVENDADVDDDGDGLIEIATPQELDQTRYNLLGSSLNTSDGVADSANGCGNGIDVTECNGYELISDIYLTNYNNWVPIGSCSASNCVDDNGFFNTVFDGDGYTIFDLTITNPADVYANASGLFGAISSTAELRNVNMDSANITGTGINVGMLVGYASSARITNSSVLGGTVIGTGGVGGLVGTGNYAIITSSSVYGGIVRGERSYVGGLVGGGSNAIITSSNATVRTVSGYNYVGGLLGSGDNAIITSSYAESENVSGNARVGGLVGDGGASNIISSYAAGMVINGYQGIGGLVGFGYNAIITSSYAESENVSGTFWTGGLVGNGDDAIITSSYAVSGTVSVSNNYVGGLLGSGTGTNITSSYARSGAVSGGVLGGLVGKGNATTSITGSYWDSNTTGITAGSYGLPKTTAELQNSTIVAGSIYADWEDDLCGGDDDSIAWDFGTDSQYPALTCTPNGLAPQRP